MFDPQYKLTNKIVSMLTTIAETRSIISRAKLLPKQELRLRRQALIRMTHASTGIEGNALNIRQVEAVAERRKIDAPSRDVYEVENYLKALRYISKVVEEKRPITERVVLQIHKLVTAKTLSESQSGHYRAIPIYVVRRRLGAPQQVLYTGPDAKKVPQLVQSLAQWIQKSAGQDINPVVVAGIVHQEIAAIHPFVDSNGRTARALATLVLYQRGYDFRRLFALEDYYNENRTHYYKAINIGKNYEERRGDFTPWLTYFVRGFKEEIDAVKAQIVSLSKRKMSDAVESQIYLSKDQLQVIDFLEQMGKITAADVMDVLECPRRTAQLQLQKLKKLSMITQVGNGPSSAYVLTR